MHGSPRCSIGAILVLALLHCIEYQVRLISWRETVFETFQFFTHVLSHLSARQSTLFGICGGTSRGHTEDGQHTRFSAFSSVSELRLPSAVLSLFYSPEEFSSLFPSSIVKPNCVYSRRGHSPLLGIVREGIRDLVTVPRFERMTHSLQGFKVTN